MGGVPPPSMRQNAASGPTPQVTCFTHVPKTSGYRSNKLHSPCLLSARAVDKEGLDFFPQRLVARATDASRITSVIATSWE